MITKKLASIRILFALIAIMVLPTVSFAAWTTEVVDGATKMFSSDPSQQNIAMDKASNTLHAAYGDETHLYHAWNTAGQWHYEQVDTSSEYTAIVVDSNGKVHMSYDDRTHGVIKYATNASGSWVKSTVAALPQVSYMGFTYFQSVQLSIAVNSAGKVYIAFNDLYHDLNVGGPFPTAIKYSTNASGSWVTTTVESNNSGYDCYGTPSLALDSGGKVYLAYVHSIYSEDYSSTNEMKYATNASGSWANVVLSTFTWDSTLFLSAPIIAIDSGKKAHIVYGDSIYTQDGAVSSSIIYLTNKTGSWISSNVDSTTIYDYYLTLYYYPGGISIDDDGNGHVAYTNQLMSVYGTPSTVEYYYANNTQSSWVPELLNTVSVEQYAQYAFSAVSLTLDSSRKAYVSYWPRDSRLDYASNATGSWVFSNVDKGGAIGYGSSMAVDSNGKEHISYLDLANGQLKYANNVSGSWVSSTLDTINPSSNMYASAATSIAVDDQDKVHISYGKINDNPSDYYSADEIVYLTNASGSWVSSVVDSLSNYDLYLHTYSLSRPKLAIDSTGMAHITYLLADSWMSEDYSSSGSTSYVNYANNLTGGWEKQAIYSSDSMNPAFDSYKGITDPKVALDISGKVHVAFNTYAISYTQQLDELIYLTDSTGSWVPATLQSSTSRSLWAPAIAVDSNKKVHISYLGETNAMGVSALNYITNLSGGWVNSAVGVTGGLDHNSIAVDSNNKVHIGYNDGEVGSVYYSSNANGSWITNTVDSGGGDIGDFISIGVDSGRKPHISYYDYSNKRLIYAKDTTPSVTPSGTVSINSCATYATSTSVTLTLTATDDVGVTGYYKSNSSTKPAAGAVGWTAVTATPSYSGSVSHTLAGTQGTNTVYVWYKDAAGNVSDTALGAIILDSTASVTTPSASYTFGTWSPSGSIGVTLSSVDSSGSGVAAGYPKYCVDITNTCTPGTTYSTSVNVTCASGAVCKQYIRYFAQDNAGNVETVKSSYVKQDLQLPVTTASATGYGFGNTSSAASIAITLSANDGTGSAIASGYPKYCVDSANSCSPSTAYASPFNVTCASGSSCTQYVRYNAQDNVGNAETVKSSTVIQNVPYTISTVTINSGADYTKSTAVSLKLYATDTDKINGYFKSNASTPPTLASPWTALVSNSIINTTVSHTLAGPAGTNTVYVWYKDTLGNISSVASDTIVYDNVVPVNGIVNSTAGDRQIEVTWRGFNDALSGVAKYIVSYATGATAPANCSSILANTVDSSYTHTSRVNNTQYSYRVCAVDNAGNMSAGLTTSTKPIEKTAPTGTVSILNGAAYTKTTAATVKLYATDADAVVSYYKANSSTPPSATTPWTALVANSIINTTVAHTLAGTAGTNTVYVWYKDRSGNVSSVASDTITYDNVAPTNGVANSVAGDSQVTVSWRGFNDALSGVASYKIAYSTVAAPANCTTGSVINATGSQYTHAPVINNLTYYYRVCAVDTAGNVSTGMPTSAKPIEHEPPVGTVSILNGASYAKSTAVTLNLSATDTDAIVGYYKNNTGTAPTASTVWNSVTAIASLNQTVKHTIAGGNAGATNTVYVWYKDRSGNVSSPASDTIIYDNVAPTNGVANSVAGDSEVTVSWRGFNDALSGVASYKIAYSTVAAPANCTTGSVINATGSQYTHAPVINNLTYYYRVCAVDTAGNISTGMPTSAKPIEHEPPVGTVSILNGASYAKSTAVTLNLSATDTDAIVGYYKNNTGTAPTASTVWNSVTAIASLNQTVKHTIVGGTAGATNTVYVWYKDRSGNVSSPASDTITYDNVAPTNGVVNATTGSGSVQLSWSGYIDAVSGVASYKIAYAASATAPANCSTAQLSAAGSPYTHTGRTVGTTYSYRVCAVDNAGNISTGVTKTIKAQ